MHLAWPNMLLGMRGRAKYDILGSGRFCPICALRKGEDALGAALARFLITAAAIPLCARFMDGVTVLDLQNALIVGAGLAVVYTVLRPLMRLILSVLNFCTLGLLSIFVDAWLVQLAPRIVENSVAFESYWWALAVAACINVARTLVDAACGDLRR